MLISAKVLSIMIVSNFHSCYGSRPMTLSLIVQEEHGIQSMTCSSGIIREMLPEIHKMKSMILSSI